MEVYALLTHSRDEYLSHYKRVAESVRASDGEIALELLVQFETVGPTDYSAIYRLDVTSKLDGEVAIYEANLDHSSTAEKKSITWTGGATVRISSLVWNDVCIEAAIPQYNDARIRSWFEKWVDVSDTNEPNTDGFSGVIHSFNVECRLPLQYSFFLDLGSAPADAMIELINIIEHQGATNILVNSDAANDC